MQSVIENLTGEMILILMLLILTAVGLGGICVQRFLIKRQLKHIEKHGLREPLKSLYNYMLELEKTDDGYAKLLESVFSTSYGLRMTLRDCHENTHEVRPRLISIDREATFYSFNGELVTELTKAEERFYNKKINQLLSVKRSKKQTEGKIKRHANRNAAEISLKNCMEHKNI